MTPDQKLLDLLQRESIATRRFDPRSTAPSSISQYQRKPEEPIDGPSQTSSWLEASTRRKSCRGTCSDGVTTFGLAKSARPLSHSNSQSFVPSLGTSQLTE
jgi:hypothetical protein